MAGINKVILIDNLGRDPEIRYTQGGSPLCRLNVATTRQWMNRQTNERQEETEWHRVSVWGKQAEHCNNYLSKGRTVYIEGRLRTSSYDDKDGQKRYSTEIVAGVVQFLGGGDQRGGGGGGGGGGDFRGGGGAAGGGGRGAPAGDRGGPPGGGDDFGDGFNGGGGGGGYVPMGPEDDDIPF